MKWLLVLVLLGSVASAQDNFGPIVKNASQGQVSQTFSPETVPSQLTPEVKPNKYGLSSRWLLGAQKDGAEIYLDMPTVKKEEGYKDNIYSIWIKQFGFTNNNNVPVKTLINCSDRTIGGKSIIPESILEDFYNNMCDKPNLPNIVELEKKFNTTNSINPISTSSKADGHNWEEIYKDTRTGIFIDKNSLRKCANRLTFVTNENGCYSAPMFLTGRIYNGYKFWQKTVDLTANNPSLVFESVINCGKKPIEIQPDSIEEKVYNMLCK